MTQAYTDGHEDHNVGRNALNNVEKEGQLPSKARKFLDQFQSRVTIRTEHVASLPQS